MLSRVTKRCWPLALAAVLASAPTGAAAAAPRALPAVPATAPAIAPPQARVNVDFNGDGYADLAIGAPNRSISAAGIAPAAGGDTGQGAVTVLYGSPSGLSRRSAQLWTEDTPGVPGVARAGDLFGFSVTAGDFNGDGFADLAVGVPRKRLAGAVVVLYGSARGLTSVGARMFSQSTAGVPGIASPGERFGASLAAGDLNGDGRADLAVGASNDTIHGRPAGSVTVLYGSAHGLPAARSQLWSQASPGVAGTPKPYDAFGSSVAIGDLNRDGRADLAIGAPEDAVGRLQSAGSVTVLNGSPGGLTARGSRRWTQTSLAVGVPSHGTDRLGQRVAVGDLNGDGYADLVAGAPTEAVHAVIAGAVVVAYGSPQGISPASAQLITEDTPGVKGAAESPDQFGFGLSIGDLNGDDIADLVVGAPGARAGSVMQTGAVVVLPGSPAGVTTDTSRRLTQDSPGVPGVSTSDDDFGLTTATGDFDRNGCFDLAVGIGTDLVGGVRAGAVDVLSQAAGCLSTTPNHRWTEAALGAGTFGEDGFGLALTATP